MSAMLFANGFCNLLYREYYVWLHTYALCVHVHVQLELQFWFCTAKDTYSCSFVDSFIATLGRSIKKNCDVWRW